MRKLREVQIESYFGVLLVLGQTNMTNKEIEAAVVMNYDNVEIVEQLQTWGKHSKSTFKKIKVEDGYVQFERVIIGKNFR